MKKVLLIGKLNRTLEDLNMCLTERFNVQVCGETAELVAGMIKIFKPDMIVISAKDLGSGAEDIINLLIKTFSGIHVLMIGTRDECGEYGEYLENEQFDELIRPMSKNQLLDKCCEYMGVDEAGEPIKADERKKLILVVDDSALSLRGTKAMLEGRYDVMAANSAKRAFKCIEKRKPDLILLDYEMPEMNGKDFLENLRFNADFFEIPVIFITALADKEHLASVLDLEPAGYFVKPLRQDKVLMAIEDVLAGKKLW
ncbi:MAG: response regulator [Lachnospiraceae bacterium]|nr:response regulator [Lachnospiraceae bacterium]